MQLRFVTSESAFDYFRTTRAYVEKLGKPVAFYSDKHGIFRVNSKDAAGGDGVTQFGRALLALNIDIICANSHGSLQIQWKPCAMMPSTPIKPPSMMRNNQRKSSCSWPRSCWISVRIRRSSARISDSAVAVSCAICPSTAIVSLFRLACTVYRLLDIGWSWVSPPTASGHT